MVQSPISVRKISSGANPTIKAARALHRRKDREKTSRCLIEGARLVEDALRARAEVETVFVTQEFTGSAHWQSLAGAVARASREVDCIMVPDSILAELCETQTPQGVAAVVRFSRPSLADLPAGEELLVLVGDRVQDPGNLGTMIRTAAAAGCSGVVLTKGTVDAFGGKAIRATMGAVFRLPVVAGVTPQELIGWARRAGCRLVLGDPGAGMIYYQASLTGKLAIVVGNEGAGPDPALMSAADTTVKIPLRLGVESLNAGVAAAVLLFEACRQRDWLKKAAPSPRKV